MRLQKVVCITLIFFLILLLIGCTVDEGENETDQAELVVYSSRNETFVNQLLEKFEEETGIKVMALHAGSGAVNRIIEERNNVRADIFISNDIGALEHLRMEGFLESYSPQGIEMISSQYRAPDNSWFALSARTRVFIFNKDLISEAEMPKTVWELTDKKAQGDGSFVLRRRIEQSGR